MLCTECKHYPYSQDEEREIAEELICRLYGSGAVLKDDRGADFTFAGHTGKLRFTNLLRPSNQFCIVTYILLMVHDDQLERLQGWQYFFISLVKPEVMKQLDVSNWKAPVATVIEILHSFTKDAVKPESDRQYKTNRNNGSYGRWDGGLSVVPANYRNWESMPLEVDRVPWK